MAIFDGIIGHDIPKQFFRNFLANPDTLPHALMLTGPPGVGKFATAFEFARVFNCLEKREFDCQCTNCHQLNLGTFSDVFITSPESEVKAEHMRRLIGEAVITPRASTHRLVILDNFERTNETAANIFLKTLEEPPDHLVFILCTSKPEGLLPTVLSRCIPVEFRTGHPSQIAEALASVFTTTDTAMIERAASTGRFGAAARELHADHTASSPTKKSKGEEPFGMLVQAFVDGLMTAKPEEFTFHLKGPLQTLIGAIEARWGLRQALPKGLDITGLRRFIGGESTDFSPVNYLTDELGKGGKLGEYDKGRILVLDLTREFYSRMAGLESVNGDSLGKLLYYLRILRQVGTDLNRNRNIELSFEKLLVGAKLPN